MGFPNFIFSELGRVEMGPKKGVEPLSKQAIHEKGEAIGNDEKLGVQGTRERLEATRNLLGLTLHERLIASPLFSLERGKLSHVRKR